ncbi:hypothetical protein B0H21DRAFT_729507 [Amylocystis lapponica]|nr:hypothetical protein B0H21DRAFT_729507 [Amylocystis lapponica]
MASVRYIPHLLYSMAITSLGMHLLRQRKAAETDRARLTAQLSILESTVQRLRSGEHIPEREFDRLWKLARSPEELPLPAPAASGEEAISWREVLLGQKQTPTSSFTVEEWDRKDLEKVRNEVEASN